MKATNQLKLAGLVTAAMLLGAAGLGCDAQERANDETLLAPPPGQQVRKWQERQIAKADADAFIIYLYEWQNEGTMLGPFGRRHMSEIVEHVPYWPYPVVIEADLDDPQLNADRRDAVIAYLFEQGVPSPEERVVVKEVLKYQSR